MTRIWCGCGRRDLKPQNLLLERDKDSSSIKIADFGLSALHHKSDSDECMLTICGTPDFLAPEVVSLSILKSTGGYSSNVDVWAVGAILYTMLAGTPPFAHPNVVHTLMAIREGVVDYSGEVWQAVSEEARTFTSYLLQADPALRPSATECLAHPWLSDQTQYPSEKLAVAQLQSYCLQRRACQVQRLARIIRIMGGRGSDGYKKDKEVTAKLEQEEKTMLKGKGSRDLSEKETFGRSSSLAEVIRKPEEERSLHPQCEGRQVPRVSYLSTGHRIVIT